MGIDAGDDWTLEGPRIDDPSTLRTIEETLSRAPIIVERGFYRGSRAPERLILDDYVDFLAWLEELRPGDNVLVWNFGHLCRDDNAIAIGKRPDPTGRTPRGGAY